MARRKPQKNPASKEVAPVCYLNETLYKNKKYYTVAEIFV